MLIMSLLLLLLIMLLMLLIVTDADNITIAGLVAVAIIATAPDIVSPHVAVDRSLTVSLAVAVHAGELIVTAVFAVIDIVLLATLQV